MKRIFLAIMIFLSGCTSWQPITTDTLSTNNDAHTLSKVPIGWAALDHGDYLTLSKEGSILHSIHISKKPIDKAFPNIDVKVKSDLLITELEKYYIANLKKAVNSHIKKYSSKPETISNHVAFKTHLTYNNEEGLPLDILTYGFIDNGYYFQLTYIAPSLHYFKRDLPIFEKLALNYKHSANTLPSK